MVNLSRLSLLHPLLWFLKLSLASIQQQKLYLSWISTTILPLALGALSKGHPTAHEPRRFITGTEMTRQKISWEIGSLDFFFFWALNSKRFVRILIQKLHFSTPSEHRTPAGENSLAYHLEWNRTFISIRRIRIILVFLSVARWCEAPVAPRRSQKPRHLGCFALQPAFWRSIRNGVTNQESIYIPKDQSTLSSCATDTMLTIIWWTVNKYSMHSPHVTPYNIDRKR